MHNFTYLATPVAEAPDPDDDGGGGVGPRPRTPGRYHIQPPKNPHATADLFWFTISISHLMLLLLLTSFCHCCGGGRPRNPKVVITSTVSNGW